MGPSCPGPHTLHAWTAACVVCAACRCLVQVDPQPQPGMFSGWFKKKAAYTPDLVGGCERIGAAGGGA